MRRAIKKITQAVSPPQAAPVAASAGAAASASFAAFSFAARCYGTQHGGKQKHGDRLFHDSFLSRRYICSYFIFILLFIHSIAQIAGKGNRKRKIP